jgi:glycine hydroxymethyltransferase
MDEVERLAVEHKPKVIIAGWSAYPRQLDFARFREIADKVGALLWVDMAHFAGLVAAGLHPRPCRTRRRVVDRAQDDRRPALGLHPHERRRHREEDQLGRLPGPAGRSAHARDRREGDGVQARRDPEFRERQERTCAARRSSPSAWRSRTSKDAGISVRSGGTDVHLVLVDLRDAAIDGKQAEDLLHEIHITVNRNAVPNDPRPPMVTSGLRIGTPALATRGFGDAEFTEVADVIALALQPGADLEALRARVASLTAAFPLYPGLAQ